MFINENRELVVDGQTYPLQSLAVDAMVHVYNTPNGIWYATQKRGKPRPMYAGVGGELIGQLELPADPDSVELVRQQNEIDKLWDSADKFIHGQISGGALTAIKLSALNGNEQCQAVEAWYQGEWAEYYRRRDLITESGENANTDWSERPLIPYAVRDLLMG